MVSKLFMGKKKTEQGSITIERILYVLGHSMFKDFIEVSYKKVEAPEFNRIIDFVANGQECKIVYFANYSTFSSGNFSIMFDDIEIRKTWPSNPMTYKLHFIRRENVLGFFDLEGVVDDA